MAQADLLIKEYYSLNQDKMIDCPFQPGNLKISQKACLKRRKAAHRRKVENFRVEDLFNFFISQGLSRCQECPIVENPVSAI
ncbi:MAG: hypothetical protein HY787_05975 [Deltaproteobacteria bacterium]|nr:hypothetical protein [Deltaproteobacteria bacterium]